MKKKALHKLIKGKVRKDYKEQGGYDGRFAEKIVPNKKRKYNRRKGKKVNEE